MGAARTRVAFLRPHDGDTVDFGRPGLHPASRVPPAGQGTPWTWYGYGPSGRAATAGAAVVRYYATFGHSAPSLDHPVPPAGGRAGQRLGRVTRRTPEFCGRRALRVPAGALARHGRPQATPRLKMTTVDVGGAQDAFESARRRPAAPRGRDALVPDGGGRGSPALRAAAPAAQPGVLEERASRHCPGGRPTGDEDDRRGSEPRPTMSYGVTPARP